jgi:hypothetical protein
MTRLFDMFLLGLAIIAAIILFVAAGSLRVDGGKVTCYAQDGKPYFEDTWSGELKVNGCAFIYTSAQTHKETTVSMVHCVAVKN